MATQSDIQAAIQSNSPFWSNNGNPGTVYNIPNTGGYVPPQSTANNIWSVNPLPVAAPWQPSAWKNPDASTSGSPWQSNGAAINHGNLAPGAWAPQAINTIAPESAYANNQFWKMPAPGGQQPGQPQGPILENGSNPLVRPPTNGGGGTVATGDPPPVGGGDNPFGGGANTGGTFNPGVWTTSPTVTTGGTYVPGTVKDVGGLANSLKGKLDNLVERFTGPEGVDWKQVLDAVSEPFLPGDLYNSMLGTTNWPNVVQSLMNATIPGLGSLSKFLAGLIPDSATGVLGKIRDFFQKGDFQEGFNDIYRNKKDDANNGNDPYTNPYTGEQGSNYINWSWLNNNTPKDVNTGTVSVGPVEQVTGGGGGFGGGSGGGWSGTGGAYGGFSGTAGGYGGWNGGSAFGGNMFGGAGGSGGSGGGGVWGPFAPVVEYEQE